jgi:hypothetical protein
MGPVSIIGNFISALSSMDKSSGHKMREETSEVIYTIDQIHVSITDNYRIFHSEDAEYTFLSTVHVIVPNYIMF